MAGFWDGYSAAAAPKLGVGVAPSSGGFWSGYKMATPQQIAQQDAQASAAAKAATPIGQLQTQLRTGKITEDQFIKAFNELPQNKISVPWQVNAYNGVKNIVNDQFVQPVKTLLQPFQQPTKGGPSGSDIINLQNNLSNAFKAGKVSQTTLNLLKSAPASSRLQAMRMAGTSSDADIQKFLKQQTVKETSIKLKRTGAALNLASNFAGGGEFVKGAKIATDATRIGTKDALLRAAQAGLHIAPAGALQGAASTVESTGKINPKEIVKNAAIGAGAGFGLGTVGSLAGEGVRSLLGKALANIAEKRAAGVPVPRSALDKLADNTTETPKITPESRPANTEQTAVETAHNAGNTAAETQAAKKLPDQAMNPNATLSADEKAAALARARETATKNPDIGKLPATEGKTAGSALKSEQRAVQAKLATEFEGKATYNEGSYKTGAENAVKLVHDNPQEARDIALGNKPGNNTIHEVAVRRAVENQALKEGDVETLRQIANSSSHTQTSEAAQRLGAEAYNADPTSPVDNMREVINARKEAVSKKLGVNIDEATAKTVKEVKASVPKVTHQTWSDFVESIRC